MPKGLENQETSDPFEIQPGPELVFGLIGPLGIDLDQITQSLQDELKRVGYKSTVIRLSSILGRIKGLKARLRKQPEHSRIRTHMKAGTELRSRTEEGGILARMAIAAIQIERKKLTGSATVAASKHAYILRSLKHREELQDLRDVYGDGFIAVSAYSPKEKRVRALTDLLAKSEPGGGRSKLEENARNLIGIDEAEEGKELGQNVEGAFPLADFFVESSDRERLGRNLRRFVEIFFGNHFLTPLRDEFGMYQAAAAARRSADLSRQVGAALATSDGAIIAVGCNDTPKVHGGLYWAEDDPDGRDFALFGYDPSEQSKREIISEMLERLSGVGVIEQKLSKPKLTNLADTLISGPLKDAQITDLLEFGRVLHAEMAAITDAARRGVSTSDATLYCTTFPCHLCARMIISTGINRVVFIEPYPKSKAWNLYYDSIVTDEAEIVDKKVNFQSFMGVAPRRYDQLFQMVGKRKKRGGEAVPWEPAVANPRIRRFQASYISIETKVATSIPNILQSARLSWKK